MNPYLRSRLRVYHGGVHIARAKHPTSDEAEPVVGGELAVQPTLDGRRTLADERMRMDAGHAVEVDGAVEADVHRGGENVRQVGDLGVQSRVVGRREAKRWIEKPGEELRGGRVRARQVDRERRIRSACSGDGPHRQATEKPDKEEHGEVATLAAFERGDEAEPCDANDATTVRSRHRQTSRCIPMPNSLMKPWQCRKGRQPACPWGASITVRPRRASSGLGLHASRFRRFALDRRRPPTNEDRRCADLGNVTTHSARKTRAVRVRAASPARKCRDQVGEQEGRHTDVDDREHGNRRLGYDVDLRCEEEPQPPAEGDADRYPETRPRSTTTLACQATAEASCFPVNPRVFSNARSWRRRCTDATSVRPSARRAPSASPPARTAGVDPRVR